MPAWGMMVLIQIVGYLPASFREIQVNDGALVVGYGKLSRKTYLFISTKALRVINCNLG